MARKVDRLTKGARAQRSLSLLALSGVLALAVPSAGFALAGQFAPVQTAAISSAITDAGRDALGLGTFTPASVDPELAARVAGKARARGVFFTPSSAPPITGKRTVTVAVRVDDDTVRAIDRKSVV